jgi:hypothetical protein
VPAQVKKDASMLDAFGKGASDDIRIAKAVLYEVSERWSNCSGLQCQLLM